MKKSQLALLGLYSAVHPGVVVWRIKDITVMPP